MTFPAFDLANRVAVVVGATSGIGKAIALGLADAGADVVPTGRRRNLVESAAREIESRGRRSMAGTAAAPPTHPGKAPAHEVIERVGEMGNFLHSPRSPRAPGTRALAHQQRDETI